MTLDGTFMTHLRDRAPEVPPTRTMRKTWMPDLTRRRWRKSSTVGPTRKETRKEGLKDLHKRVADAIKDGYRFEASVEDDGQRVIGGEANAGVSFQIGKIR